MFERSNDFASYRVTFESLFEKDLTTEEAHHVVSNFDKKIKEVRGLGKGNVVETATKVWDYFSNTQVSKEARIIAGVALLYFILPYDLIPDATPFLGYADDLAMMALALRRLATLASLAQVARGNFRDHYSMDS